MPGCEFDNLSVKEIADAIQNKHEENKVIVVPMFQRGERWNFDQQRTFIDSLIKGYPVGSLLFYKKFENGKQIYIVVDGLQRCNCISNFMTNPTSFLDVDNIPDDVCAGILDLLGKDDMANYGFVRSSITKFIKEQGPFINIQFYTLAKQIVRHFEIDDSENRISKIITRISDFSLKMESSYNSIAKMKIPVNFYSGDETTLPEIFERINSKGTPLDQYEIYAASWPINDKFVISNPDIIEYIIKKYDSLVNDGLVLRGYDRERLRSERKVNAFEYLFGLSKYLVNRFDILGFNRKLADDVVNSLAFELVNACLNDTDKISVLYKNLQGINVNEFETALIRAIEFVRISINVVTSFKGNIHKANKIFHTKYQIMSMISFTFKEMFPSGNFNQESPSWDETKQKLQNNLIQYYIYDIMTKYWGEGGTKKIYSDARSKRYLKPITDKEWALALAKFFEDSMQRDEKAKIANPGSAEYVFLNCIYANTFTAMDQLSGQKFDVEHIAPKEQMKKLIKACGGTGLPISCIANLCYLPEAANRSKGALNFYQDEGYLSHISLKEVEKKYSFTEEEDLDWMDMPYNGIDDFSVLREYYTEFCTNRFEKMEQKFCAALGIKYIPLGEIRREPLADVVVPTTTEDTQRSTDLLGRCVQKLANALDEDLVRVTKNCYRTQLSNCGYTIVISKAYNSGSRERYWFGYRRKPKLAECNERYCLFVCKDESTILKIPETIVEENLDNMTASRREDGTPKHWHIIFFKDREGHITWHLLKPQRGINVDGYLM